MNITENFSFNKNFGQNFLQDKNLLNAIVKDSGISCYDEVLEIGTGAGTLTEAISNVAKKVVSYEIDKKLTEFLEQKFLNKKNVKIIIADALKLPISNLESNFDGNYHIIANLPYYITTPLIFKFIEQTEKVQSLTIMVQREVAEKIIAKPKENNYGVLSVVLQYYCTPKITRIVKKTMFTPRPKVDSAIVYLKRNKEIPFEENFSKFIAGCFSMKRKTLNNNLSKLGFSKEQIIFACEELKISPQIRAEELSVLQFRQLYLKIVKNP